jgi:hypothetical protein
MRSLENTFKPLSESLTLVTALSGTGGQRRARNPSGFAVNDTFLRLLRRLVADYYFCYGAFTPTAQIWRENGKYSGSQTLPSVRTRIFRARL